MGAEDQGNSAKGMALKVLVISFLVFIALWTLDAFSTDMSRVVDRSSNNQTAMAAESDLSWSNLYQSVTATVVKPLKTVLAILKLNPTAGDVFASLPATYGKEVLPPTQFIKFIVINTNPEGRVYCSENLQPYEFFVLLADGENILDGMCGLGKDKYDFAAEISAYLKYSRGFPSFTKEELLVLPVVIGDGQAALKNLTGI